MKAFVIALIVLCSGLPFIYAEEKPKPAKLELVSSAFGPNEDIPLKYTCQGGDMNPPLEIKNIPPKTKTLALTVQDLDAPEGVWVHWVVYNIPPNKNVIAENTIPAYEALNDFGKYHYGGPCPADDKPHRYVFRAYAINDILVIDEGMTIKDLEKAISGRTIAKSELTGIYRKPIW